MRCLCRCARNCGRQITDWSGARIDVVPAALGDDSVLYGALALAENIEIDDFPAAVQNRAAEGDRDRSIWTRSDQAIECSRRRAPTGRHIFVCGNGGSASTASHFACDIVKGASFNRASRFRIMALTDQLPTLTAYANDVSYDCVFVEQLQNFAERRRPVHGHQRLRQLAQRAARHRVRQLNRLPHHRPHRARRRQTRPAGAAQHPGRRCRTWAASKTRT